MRTYSVVLALMLSAGAAAPSVGVAGEGGTASAGVTADSRDVAEDEFYVPPEPLPEGQPGDVIRARPSSAGWPSTQELADAWQVMYLSTDAQGERNAVTGTVLVPKNIDPSSAPVIGFGPGTQGPAFRCAPSRMIRMGAFYEQPAVNDLLRSGYAVAVTDYEGYHPQPDTSYVVGEAMGPALIDGVRAAQRLSEAGLSTDSEVAFRGYSQGGGAAMWAGQMQPSYAPELDLVGVAGGGVPADLTQVSLPLDGSEGFGLLATALIGLDNAYPELDLASYLNDAGKTAFANIEQDACALELLTDYRGKRLADYTTESPVLQPGWLERVADNKLGNTGIQVPVFQFHATNDELVAFSQARALRDDYCSRDVRLTWKAYDTDHITLVHRGNEDVLGFIKDRIAGEPAGTTC